MSRAQIQSIRFPKLRFIKNCVPLRDEEIKELQQYHHHHHYKNQIAQVIIITYPKTANKLLNNDRLYILLGIHYNIV
jgi:hypothetical protein